MGAGMNLEQAKELASKKNYKWAVGNLECGSMVRFYSDPFEDMSEAEE